MQNLPWAIERMSLLALSGRKPTLAPQIRIHDFVPLGRFAERHSDAMRLT
jgi:hypothetical protein